MKKDRYQYLHRHLESGKPEMPKQGDAQEQEKNPGGKKKEPVPDA